MAINLTSDFSPKGPWALDNRTHFDTLSKAETFIYENENITYPGMQISIGDDLYILKNEPCMHIKYPTIHRVDYDIVEYLQSDSGWYDAQVPGSVGDAVWCSDVLYVVTEVWEDSNISLISKIELVGTVTNTLGWASSIEDALEGALNGGTQYNLWEVKGAVYEFKEQSLEFCNTINPKDKTYKVTSGTPVTIPVGLYNVIWDFRQFNGFRAVMPQVVDFRYIDSSIISKLGSYGNFVKNPIVHLESSYTDVGSQSTAYLYTTEVSDKNFLRVEIGKLNDSGDSFETTSDGDGPITAVLIPIILY